MSESTTQVREECRLGEDRIDFLQRLARMSPDERLRAARDQFDRRRLAIWAARYPKEVPLVNGEYEWIALRLP
ncbi:MAG: hypothetical protein WB507_12140 [Solirubrobacterales bacterium]